MSNYYDLKCLDCNQPGPYDNANRAYRELLMVLKLRPQLEALGVADRRVRTEAGGSYFGREYEDTVPDAARFLADHIGHTVVVKSEYGHDAYFGCDEYVDEVYKDNTAPRENTRECRLDRGHEGPHSRTRPDGQ